MPTTRSFQSNTNSFQQSGVFLDRPRLHKLLKKSMDYPLAAVYAGMGYGKTQAVHSFLQQCDAHTTWIQLSERDNVTTRFWDNYTHMVSLTWPEIGARLQEIGFPKTEDAFAKYVAQRHEALATQKRSFLVYDDFHLIHDPAVLNFFEKAIKSMPPNATVILISRTIPEINMVGFMMQERVFTITEDTLCFTEEEIAEYFSQQALQISRQDIRDIYDDTQGWALAINLFGRSLGKNAKYERYTLEALKANIFRLIEAEILQSVSKRLCHFLLRIALLDDHAASLVRSLTDDEELLQELETLNAYIRYDYYLGAYMIHHLFLDYLRQYLDRVPEEEKREIYNKAGQWYETNNYHIDALTYHEKAGNYETILEIVYRFDLQVPHDMAKYALEICERMPQEVKEAQPLFWAMVLKLKINLGLLEESSHLVKQYTLDFESRPASPENNRALSELYGIWAVLRIITCMYTDEYDFDLYFQKQREYYDKNPYPAQDPYINLPGWSYALLVGVNRAGAPEEYIEALTRSIPHASHVLKGNLYGLDDLAQGELCFYQREFNCAEQFLQQALGKAQAKNQYDIQNRALQYLMMISFSRGDIKTAQSILDKMEALLEQKEFTKRYESFDIALSHYHLALGQPEQIPEWLKADFLPYTHPVFLENYTNRIKAQYRYLTCQYNELLAFLKNAQESQTVLFGKIVFKVLEALSLYKLKRKEEAITALTEAYTLAAPNQIIIPFTQYAKDMRTLTAAALKDESCPIPPEWLENINRKASAYSKRQSHMVAGYRAVNNLEDEISLTQRETEILRDLAQGLSRSEIAGSQNISTNTVKMMINAIYEKLNAKTMADAIRIAVDRKIV